MKRCVHCGFEHPEPGEMAGRPAAPLNVRRPGFGEVACWVMAMVMTLGIVGSLIIMWLLRAIAGQS